METLDAIAARRQVREFADRPLESSDLHQILDAARRSPSGRNGQPWDFVVVSDQAELERLSHVWQGARWIPSAAAVVAVVVPGGGEESVQLSNRFDLGQAVSQMMIAATGIGVASGLAGCQDQELARDILGHPSDRECAILIALGYSASGELRPLSAHDRRPFDDVVHMGRW